VIQWEVSGEYALKGDDFTICKKAICADVWRFQLYDGSTLIGTFDTGAAAREAAAKIRDRRDRGAA
jgi:hypothetical protein